MKKQKWYLQRRKNHLQKRENPGEMIAGACIRIMGFTMAAFVAAITFYLLYKGIPFFLKYGADEMLLRSRWEPLGDGPGYGISYMIGATIFGTFGAMALAMPIGIFTAVFMAELAPGWISDILEPVIEILAGIPSILYGILGLTIVTPFLYRIERGLWAMRGENHMPSGGANLMASILVLAVMILPTVIITSKTVIKAVPRELKNSAMALGATKLQTIFGVILPKARSGLLTAGLLSMGRVLGETMAVSFVSGGMVKKPALFSPVRFLTTALVGEMGYAVGTHREALFSIGLILYLLIMALIGGVHVLTEKKE